MHFHHLTFFYFQKGKNTAKTAKKICSVYGNGAIAENTVCKWVVRFRRGNFDLKKQKLFRKHAVNIDDQIISNVAIIIIIYKNNTGHMTQDILMFSMSFVRILKSLGYVNYDF